MKLNNEERRVLSAILNCYGDDDRGRYIVMKVEGRVNL